MHLVRRFVSFVPVFLAALLLTADGWAQSSDLPSAPSAVLEQQKPKPPTPAPEAKPPASSSNSTSSSAPSTDKQKAEVPASGNQDLKPEQKAEALAAPANPPADTKPPAKTPTGSQSPDVPIDAPAETIRVGVNEVNVIFTVTDKHGKFIKDLTPGDIHVVDDHKAVEKIDDFHSQTNLPLRVGLLIDASNSIRDRFKFEQEAAIEFLNQIVRPKTDLAFVLGFDTTAEVTQDFTNDNEKLSRGVRMLRPGGGTALYDAVYFACRDKLKKASDPGGVRRAIILVSDGEDNQSRVTREEAVDMAQRAEVIIYSISTNTSGMILHGDKVLQYIAESTGGRAFFPFKIEDVANAFSEIQEELRSQYALAYKPPDFRADGHFRAIEVVAQNNKKFHVRTRKGYYAPTTQ